MEARAWTIVNGTKAPQAAGKIHLDIEKALSVLKSYPSMTYKLAVAKMRLKKKGLVRLEGKDYVMKDGDVTHFRFNV